MLVLIVSSLVPISWMSSTTSLNHTDGPFDIGVVIRWTTAAGSAESLDVRRCTLTSSRATMNTNHRQDSAVIIIEMPSRDDGTGEGM